MSGKSGASSEKTFAIEQRLKCMDELLAAFRALAFPDVLNGALLIGELIQKITSQAMRLNLLRAFRSPGMSWQSNRLRVKGMIRGVTDLLIGVQDKGLVKLIGKTVARSLRRHLSIKLVIVSGIMSQVFAGKLSARHCHDVVFKIL